MSYCSCIGLDLESAVDTITENIKQEMRELDKDDDTSISCIADKCIDTYLVSYCEDEDIELEEDLQANIIDEILNELDFETIIDDLTEEGEYNRDPLGYHGLSERDFYNE